MAFEGMSDDDVVMYISHASEDRARGAGAAEMQRRLIVAIHAFSDCASMQTAQVIKLTDSIRVLTYALVAVGVLQVVLIIWR